MPPKRANKRPPQFANTPPTGNSSTPEQKKSKLDDATASANTSTFKNSTLSSSVNTILYDAEPTWAVLVPLKGNPYRHEIQLKSHQYIIGRGNGCQAVLTNPAISNKHCIFHKQSTTTADGNTTTEYFLEDLSSNGTFVGGIQVPRPQGIKLTHGAIIEFPQESATSLQFTFLISETASPPTNFAGKYTLVQELGKGHFATVHLAVPKGMDPNDPQTKKVAVKIIDKSKTEHPKIKENLKSEITILRTMNHPSITNIYEVFDEPNYLYIVMEYVPEKEFFDFIYDRRALTEPQTKRVFIQIFRAVKYLHDHNIVHRDLKPENILVANKEKLIVKVSDFGLAKLLGSESLMTTLCGTPTYVAPEILQPKDRREYDSKVDMWSLGVILYICLCGYPPFSNEIGPPLLTTQIRNGKYTFASPFWDNIGSDAKDLVSKLLKVDPNQRLSIDEALDHPFMKNIDFGGDGVEDIDYLKRIQYLYHIRRDDTAPIKLPRLRRVKSEEAERVLQEKSPEGGMEEIEAPVISDGENLNSTSQLYFTAFGMQPIDGTIYSSAEKSLYTTAHEDVGGSGVFFP